MLQNEMKLTHGPPYIYALSINESIDRRTYRQRQQHEVESPHILGFIHPSIHQLHIEGRPTIQQHNNFCLHLDEKEYAPKFKMNAFSAVAVDGCIFLFDPMGRCMFGTYLGPSIHHQFNCPSVCPACATSTLNYLGLFTLPTFSQQHLHHPSCLAVDVVNKWAEKSQDKQTIFVLVIF